LAWRGKAGIRSEEIGGYLKTKVGPPDPSLIRATLTKQI
jgi:hypothetical protein